MKVTDLKTKELNENAMEKKLWILNKLCQCDFLQQQILIYLLQFPFFIMFPLGQIWNSEEDTCWTVKLLSVIPKCSDEQIFP